MTIKVWTDPRTGATARSNGSDVGNAFMDAFIEAGKQIEREDASDADKAEEAGASMFHTWDGWFALNRGGNNYQSGAGPYGVGTKAKFHPPHYLYGWFKTPEVGGYICIRDNKSLTMWKIVEIRKTLLNYGDDLFVEYERTL